MGKINIVDTGHVYRNPKPHLWARGASFPPLGQLDDGELLAAMDIGSAFESLDIPFVGPKMADAAGRNRKKYSNPTSLNIRSQPPVALAV